MNRVHVVSQLIPNDENGVSGKNLLRFFYNKENEGEPTWYSADGRENFSESPESTISYIKNEQQINFFLRLVYD